MIRRLMRPHARCFCRFARLPKPRIGTRCRVVFPILIRHGRGQAFVECAPWGTPAIEDIIHFKGILKLPGQLARAPPLPER